MFDLEISAGENEFSISGMGKRHVSNGPQP